MELHAHRVTCGGRLTLTLELPFLNAQLMATAIVIGSNFLLNNYLTFADRPRTGWDLLSGLLMFGLVCSVGALNNLGVASLLLASEPQAWGLAGLAGGAMSLMWNYAVGSALVWPVARAT